MGCFSWTVGVAVPKEAESEAFLGGVVKFGTLGSVGCVIWGDCISVGLVEFHFEVLRLSVVTDAFRVGFLGLWWVDLVLALVPIWLVEEFLNGDGDVHAGRAAARSVYWASRSFPRLL